MVGLIAHHDCVADRSSAKKCNLRRRPGRPQIGYSDATIVLNLLNNVSYASVFSLSLAPHSSAFYQSLGHDYTGSGGCLELVD